jgi:hypothetical protein
MAREHQPEKRAGAEPPPPLVNALCGVPRLVGGIMPFFDHRTILPAMESSLEIAALNVRGFRVIVFDFDGTLSLPGRLAGADDSADGRFARYPGRASRFRTWK